MPPPIGVNGERNPSISRKNFRLPETHFSGVDGSWMNSNAFPWLKRVFSGGNTKSWFCDPKACHWLLWRNSSSFGSHISTATDFRSMDPKTFFAQNFMIFRSKGFSRGVSIENKEVRCQISMKLPFEMRDHVCIGCKIEMFASSSTTLSSLRRLVFEINAKSRFVNHPV